MPDQRLGPSRRVRQRQDFLRIQECGKKWRSRHFLLAIGEPHERPEQSASSAESRLGVTITRRVDKRAARRNRVKRRVREFFRRQRPKFCRTADVIVIALSGSTELTFLATVRELKYLFHSAGLLPERGPRREPSASQPPGPKPRGSG